jgi:hypothetical protein
MKKELKTLIQELADIQITSFEKLKAVPNSVDQYQLNELIEFNNNDILEVLDRRIRYWQFIKEMPEAITGIPEYQLGICVHILFVMEETWVQTNVDGVIAMWDLFDEMYKKFHPEIKLIWLPQKN